jgi:hypothetical protein
MNRRFLPLLLLAALPVTAAPDVKEITPELRTKYDLPDAYKKIAFSGVFPVVGSDKSRVTNPWRRLPGCSITPSARATTSAPRWCATGCAWPSWP